MYVPTHNKYKYIRMYAHTYIHIDNRILNAALCHDADALYSLKWTRSVGLHTPQDVSFGSQDHFILRGNSRNDHLKPF